MGWKAIHRWLGLTAGTLALVLGLSGAILAFDPVQQAWQAPAAPSESHMRSNHGTPSRASPVATESTEPTELRLSRTGEALARFRARTPEGPGTAEASPGFDAWGDQADKFQTQETML